MHKVTRMAFRAIALVVIVAISVLVFHYYVRMRVLEHTSLIVVPGKWVWVECQTLSPSASILLWSDEKNVHIEWNNAEKSVDGEPAWSAIKGSFRVFREDFIREVGSFHARLIEQMSSRVDEVIAGALASDIRIDLPGLVAEHKQRMDAFKRALENTPRLVGLRWKMPLLGFRQAPPIWRIYMDRNRAEQLMAIYGRISAGLNEASDLVLSLPKSEQAPHAHGLGSVMADLWLKLQLPIVREHRELDPDGDKFLQPPQG